MYCKHLLSCNIDRYGPSIESFWVQINLHFSNKNVVVPCLGTHNPEEIYIQFKNKPNKFWMNKENLLEWDLNL